MPWRLPIFDFGQFFVRNHEIMQLLRHDHADRWPRIDYSRCRHTQISTLLTQQSTNITLKAAAANLIRSSSRMDEGQAEGLWRWGRWWWHVCSLSLPAWPSIAITGARGSCPLMVILLQMLAGRWGAWRRSGRHYVWGGSSIPPLHPTQQSTIYWKRLEYRT